MRFDVGDSLLLVFPLELELGSALAQVGDLLLNLGHASLGILARLLLQGFLFDLEAHDLAARLLEERRHVLERDAQAGSGLVHQVDDFVRQKAIGDIAAGQVDGGDDGVVGDMHAVEELVLFLDAAQNGDGILGRGLVDVDRLETARQSGILFDVFLVFLDSSGADGAEFAACQGRFQHVRCVHGAFGRACADQCVDLIDEEDDLAVGLLDFLEYVLEALLELAAVLGARDKGAQVERDQLLVLEGLGNVALGHAQGQAFGNSGLAHAGLADQNRIIFRTARQDLNDALDLLVAADDRVELVLAGQARQRAGVFIEGAEFLGLGVLGYGGILELLDDGGHVLLVYLEAGQGVAGRAGHVEYGKEDVLRRDKLVLHVGGHAHAVVQDLGQVGREVDLVRRREHAAALGSLELFEDQIGQHHRVDLHLVEDGRDHALVLEDEGTEQVHGIDVVLAALYGQFVGSAQGFPGFGCELLREEACGYITIQISCSSNYHELSTSYI